MVTDGGIQKGMKTVLEETNGLNADGLKELLWQYEVVFWYTCMFLQFCDMIYQICTSWPSLSLPAKVPLRD